MKRNETIYETAKFYYENKKPVHITLKTGVWLNGIILSVNEDFKDRLVLAEEKFGEMIILFDRIKDDGIEPREEERK